MAIRVGINGFGRIGRQVLKAILERHPQTLEVVAINDLFDTKTNAHLFKYDSNYGTYDGTVVPHESAFVIDGHEIRVTAERDPGKIPWGDSGVQLVGVDGVFHGRYEGSGAPGCGREEGHHQRAGAQ